MRILDNNLISESTTLVKESSAKTGFPVTNVKVPQLARVFKFDGNSGNLIIDLGSEININAVVIGNTNMTTSGTITLEGNASDSWGAPSYSQSFTINTTRNKNQMLFLDEDYRYFRIVFSDATLTDISIGHIFIGDYLQIDKWDMNNLDYNSTGTVNVSTALQVYGNKGLTFKTWSTIVPANTDVEFNNFFDFWEDNQGVEPVYLVLYEESISTFPPYFVIVQSEAIPTNEDSTANDRSFNLDFREVR